MSEIRTVHTAREPYDCDSEPCDRTIPAGARYLAAALPPSDEGNGTDHWLRMKVCQPCAERWGEPMDEQVTPRRARRRREVRIARHTDALRTVPSRPFRDEPHLDRPITTVHVPALTA